MSVVADAAERARAVDVTTSFVVQAPAGSGKTGLLVLRFLALLALVERPEAVLAITFTRKAAGEMRRRIVDALTDAAAPGEPPPTDFERERWRAARAVLDRDAALGWGLAHSPSRLQVFTIDSFCSRVVAGTPLLSRLGSTPSVVADPAPLYREAVRRTLAPSGRALLGEHLEVLLERYEMGLDRLEDQIVGMLDRREQWRAAALGRDDEDAWIAAVEEAFRDAVAVEVAAVADGAEPGVVSCIHRLAAASRAIVGDGCAWPTLGASDRLGTGADAAPAWKQASALLLQGPQRPVLRTSRSGGPVHAGDAGVKAELQAVLDAIRELPEAAAAAWGERLRTASRFPVKTVFGPDGRAALSAFLAVLRHALAMLWTVFRERGEVDYTEISLGAVAALAPGETLEKLDARIDHILVDEFQDTNVLQCELLRGLTSGWTPDDGRTLFLVGDPMQSIYRFRKAEVGLFLAARSEPGFLGSVRLEPLQLSVNFRSTTNLVAWAGRTFARLLGNRDDAARSLVAFAPAAPGPQAAEGPDAEFVLWQGDAEAKGLAADAVEAAGLADWIAREVDEFRTRGEARKHGATAPLAVLVRARTHAQPLLRALEARAPGVRVRAPGLDMLSDRASVIDLEALARALLHPGDRLAWAALLRSRQVGITLADLAELIEHDVAQAGGLSRATPVPQLLVDAAAMARVSPDARRRLQRLGAVLDAARRDLASRSVDVAVRSAWLRLGGPAAGPDATRVDALDAEAFFDLLAGRARAGRVDLDDFARALRETEAPVDVDAEVDVEVMTMHKAKGLEFDTVVLPALGRASGRGTALPLAMETAPDSGRLTRMAPRGARGRDDADGDKYDFLQMREKRRGETETLRLLYVAATRARRRLLLSASQGRLVDKGTRAASGSLLAALAPALPVASAHVAQAPPPAGLPPRHLLRFVAEHRAGELPPSVADRSIVTELPSAHVGDVRFSDDAALAAAIGTAFHAFAERIASDGVEAWTPERVRADPAFAQHALRREGVAAADLGPAVARVLEAMAATVGDERGRWILAPHDEARSEWALTAWDDRGITSAQIDRTFVADGVRWVVDYKTTEWDEDAADADAQVRERCSEHAVQLGHYRRLMLAAFPGLPVRTALYFPQWPAGRRWQDITGLVEAVADRPA